MSSRRGFLLITVMALLIVVIATIGWCVQRSLYASHAVDVRIQNYRDHHEVQGLKAIVSRWYASRETRQAASDRARAGEDPPEYRAELPNRTAIVLRLTDGQGTILARLDNVPSIQTQEAILNALREIPSDRDDLVRRCGPPTISLQAAPSEVLLALAGGDAELASALEAMKASLPRDNGEFVRRLMAAGFEEQRARDLTLVITMDPSIWRVDAEVIDAEGSRWYALLVGEQDGLPRIYECRRLVGREEAVAVSTRKD